MSSAQRGIERLRQRVETRSDGNGRCGHGEGIVVDSNESAAVLVNAAGSFNISIAIIGSRRQRDDFSRIGSLLSNDGSMHYAGCVNEIAGLEDRRYRDVRPRHDEGVVRYRDLLPARCSRDRDKPAVLVRRYRERHRFADVCFLGCCDSTVLIARGGYTEQRLVVHRRDRHIGSGHREAVRLRVKRNIVAFRVLNRERRQRAILVVGSEGEYHRIPVVRRGMVGSNRSATRRVNRNDVIDLPERRRDGHGRRRHRECAIGNRNSLAVSVSHRYDPKLVADIRLVADRDCGTRMRHSRACAYSSMFIRVLYSDVINNAAVGFGFDDNPVITVPDRTDAPVSFAV